MKLNTQYGKPDKFTARVSIRGSKLNPGPIGVLISLMPDDDVWRAAYVWVSPAKARAMAALLLRAADRAEEKKK